jgi:YbbR domain-containing protein
MNNKRLQIILATTLFAILLWISVNLSYQYKTTINVPLIVENLPQHKAMMTPIPRSLQLKLRGDGWRLAALRWGAVHTCVLDLNSLPLHQRSLTLNEIADRLSIPFGIQPIDMKPESLFIAYDTYSQRKVPVHVLDAVSFHEGYGQVGPPTIVPESVTVGGAASVVETVNSWDVSKGELENLKTTFEGEVPLSDTSMYMLSLSPARVHVRINVQPFAEKTFSGVPVEILAAPPNREVILIPPKIDLIVRGGIDQLSSLATIDFRASVDYAATLSDSGGYLTPDIIPPPAVQVVARKPERLQYFVRKRL